MTAPIQRVVPVEIRLWEYAAAINETERVARRRLQGAKIYQVNGKRIAFVDESALRGRLPGDYERVYEWFERNPREGRSRGRARSTTRADV